MISNHSFQTLQVDIQVQSPAQAVQEQGKGQEGWDGAGGLGRNQEDWEGPEGLGRGQEGWEGNRRVVKASGGSGRGRGGLGRGREDWEGPEGFGKGSGGKRQEGCEWVRRVRKGG